MNFNYKTRNEKFPQHLSRVPGGLLNNPNPGNISNLHKKTRDIMPIWLEGVEFGHKMNLTSNKILLCNWMMSHITPSGFRIGGIYNWKINDNLLGTPVISADFNPSTLSTNFTVLYHPIPKIRIEVANKFISIEHIGKSSTACFNIENISENSLNIALGYMKSLSSHLSFGTELSMNYKHGLYNPRTAIAARYNKDSYVVAGSISSNSFDFSYWRQVHKFIQLGSSLVYNNYSSKVIGAIFYHWELKDAYIRGMIDSDWSVGFTYNRRFPELCFNLGFSLLYSMSNNKFISGFKFDVDPNIK